jgi:isopentenyl-diphosphate delta-isomerase
MKEVFSFVYKADLGNGIFEHEFDHVFIGKSDEFPMPDRREVSEWKWMSTENISNEIDNHPNDFTIWFQLIFKDVARVYKEM